MVALIPTTTARSIRQPRVQRSRNSSSHDMNRVAAIILSGGEGKRLFPLTLTRSKPAISFGGRYRLIDVPISNALNSGCHKIYIITQFLSSSIHQHIFQTYRHDIFSSGFLELLPAEQKPSKRDWFEGTADAVRQNADYILEAPVDYFLILSGDQLYNMDFQLLVQQAKQSNADLLVAALPITRKNCSRMGLLQIDGNKKITSFVEKPKDDSAIANMELPAHIKQSIPNNNEECKYLASMGIYLFKRDVLLKLLIEDPRPDFGKHLLPTIIKQGNAAAYIFNGYWEDVGTIESFYNANIALTLPEPAFNCYDEERPIYAMRYNLPGAKIFQSEITQSILCEGSIVEASSISHSILGPRTIVNPNTVIQNSYLMGCDYYTPPANSDRLPNQLQIGSNCIIKNSIIDKNACLGDNVKLVNQSEIDHYDGTYAFIRDGIIIIPRGVNVPDGFII